VDLSTVISEMRVTVDWIHRREVFLQLASGTYTSVRTTVDVRAELHRLLAGRCQVALASETPRMLEVDVDMLAVMIEEGASNAVKYKAEGSTVFATATLVPESGHETLRVALDNAIPAEKPPLTQDECVAAFKKGSKGANASARADGIGLATVTAASRAAGGRATLRSYVDGWQQAHVVYCIVVPVARSTHSYHDGDKDHSGSFSSVTASTVEDQDARLSYDYTLSPPSSSLPATRESERHSSTLRLNTGLTCVGCDDSSLLRPLIQSAFEMLGASTSTVLGANAQEISIVVDVALGLVNGDGTRCNPPAPPADLVLFDVHIDVDNRPFVKGTQLAAELRQRGFKGFIALFTAGTNNDLRQLLKFDHANCVLMKSLQGPALYEQLHEEYEQFARKGLAKAKPLVPHFCRHSRHEEFRTVAPPIPPKITCDPCPGAMGELEKTTDEDIAAGAAKGGEHVDPPSVSSSLLDLKHMENLPESVASALLQDFFCESSASGMLRMMDKLEESVCSGLDGVQLHDLVHNMIGDCKCAGAVAVAAHLEAFEISPTVGAIASMRDTIELTKQEAQKLYMRLR